MSDWSANGARLTDLAPNATGLASALRWVEGDAHYVALEAPSMTLVNADCSAEDEHGRRLALPRSK